MWRLASDYLRLLGPELVGRMGYSFAELERTLAERRPGLSRLATLPLRTLLAPPPPGLPRRILRRLARRVLLQFPRDRSASLSQAR
jgi:hypothetical protein